MIGKFIECAVAPEMIERFSKAQESWDSIEACLGFKGQFGGWTHGKSKAFVFAQWDALASLESFMTSKHDEVLEASQQTHSYQKLSISILKRELEIPSISGLCSVSVEDIKFVRISDCVLRPEGEHRFRESQENIWNPGMSRSAGMLGGSMWKCQQNPMRFLVSSFWESEESHHLYVENSLPGLRPEACIDQYIESIKGYHFETESKWTICPKN